MKDLKGRIISKILAVVMIMILAPIIPGTLEKASASAGVEINEVNFPDKNFRNYVKDEFDKDNNKKHTGNLIVTGYTNNGI